MTETTMGAPSAPRMLRGRIAVSLCFLTFGMAVGLWFVHVPVVVARLSLPPGLLGLVLFCIGAIGLITQPIAAVIVGRFGARRVVLALLPTTIAASFLTIASPSIPLLFVFAILVGTVATPGNVATNTLAAHFETLRGRPTMSSFHGFFSLGGLISSVLGGFIIGAGFGDGRGAFVVDAILFVAAIWAALNAIDTVPQPVVAGQASRGPRFAFPALAILGICLIAAICNMVEGSIGDWSALYLATVKNTGPALAAAGYGMFSIAMAGLRFVGGPLVERLGSRRLVVGGGVLMAIGMLIVVLAPWPLVSALGFLVVAIGASNISPVLMSTAAHTPGVPSEIGVAALGASLTVGFLTGPPIIGFIAQGWGLATGLGFVAALGIIVAIGASLRRWDTPAAAPAE